MSGAYFVLESSSQVNVTIVRSGNLMEAASIGTYSIIVEGIITNMICDMIK